MGHKNRNALLSLYYHETSPQEERKIREHLAECEDCRDYMKLLTRMDSRLNHWRDEQPLPDSFDRILANIPLERPRVVYVKPAISARPLFNIALALLFILLSIYFVQSQLSMLSVWQSIEQSWFFQAFGRFGVVTVLFLAIGSFITLSLAPILYFDLNKRALHI